MKDFYTPMEKVLIEGTILATGGIIEKGEVITGDDCVETIIPEAAINKERVVQFADELAAALKTKEQTTLLLELDEKLLAMEEKHGMIDGLPEEAWLL